ncbi:hypothetical protein WI80_33395 [Burkholderia ubonensis]|uniref:hypothetical protein n=1 Tax=Burkholderia ubonensis TaxID=101571 RepID=UPI000752A41B|nr:hypothetical protein [Burkholderia ubonensis]KVD19192.1 hypothetical protein WI80_33395 [Burkholderia ubonensis]KVU12671.1 hypothetical protein WK63_19425 [Burkholderia ubonensis]
MQNFRAVLDGNAPYIRTMRGMVLLIQTADQGNALTVQLLRGGAVLDTVDGIGPGAKLVPRGGFDGFTIEGAAGVVQGVVTMGDIDIQLAQINTNISNDATHPVPVSLVSAPGQPIEVTNAPGQDLRVTVDGPVNVTGAQLTATNVGINNTDANPVPVKLHASDDATPIPVAGTVTIGNAAGAPVPTLDVKAQTPATVAPVPVAAGATGTVLLAVDAARRAVRFFNPAGSAGPVAIVPDNATVYASAAIVLNPGDFWNETEAPGAAWFASTPAGTGATVNIQTVKA